ncbi:MAG: ORF2 [Xinjiang mamastrovirus 6]|nr:MAG: ORF2 [Xinjiang mamastrovirus 6]
MASRQQKRQPPRPTTNIVVRNGTVASQAGPSSARQGRRRRNRRRPPPASMRVLTSKNQNRRRGTRPQGLGNRVVVQRIVSTLGTVGANGSGEIETELAVLLNPCTMKESTASNTYGPLQIFASTYTLFQIRSLKLHLKPLVGSAPVSGTVVRMSWNPACNPTQTSWSALGARKHTDTTPGRDGRFTLTARDLLGPKAGWYRTNTKGEPMMAFAGSLEIHTFGQTLSTYKNAKYEGGLFLAELDVLWAFKDYSQQPGLTNLLKGDSDGNATIKTDDEGKLILTTPGTSTLARAARTTTASEIIWMVTDAIITAGASALPFPFSWLIRGGWWFLKRIAGAPTRNGEEQFVIYASINDARASVPCAVSTAITPIDVGRLHFQQITPGNTGIGPDIPHFRAIDYQDPDSPPQQPNRIYVTRSTMLQIGTTNSIPSACVWYNRSGGQMHQQGVGLSTSRGVLATFNVHAVSVISDVGQVTPDMFPHRIPLKLYGPSGNPTLGYAVASSYTHIQDTPNLWVSNLLAYVDYERSYAYSGPWHITTLNYPSNGYRVNVSTPSSAQAITLNIQMRAGQWYVVQFVAQGQISGQYYAGEDVIASNSTQRVNQLDSTWSFSPTQGDATCGILPAYMNGLQLKPLTTGDVTYSETIHRSLDTQEDTFPGNDLHPSFGCDDALEFPPPPSEEDLADDEDEFEDPEDPEDDEDEELELGPDDDYSDPPISRLVVHPDAQQVYEQLRARFSDREARLAANQLVPSGEYTQFTEMYHNALVDGLSPREARAFALGL